MSDAERLLLLAMARTMMRFFNVEVLVKEIEKAVAAVEDEQQEPNRG